MVSNDAYDVVIVGAGTAGCTAAICLPPGSRALIVDRAGSGPARCCGGLLAPDAQAALALLRLELPTRLRVRPEPKHVHVHDLDSGRRRLYRRDYLNVDRALFDAWLLDMAGRQAEVCGKTRFVGKGSSPGEILLAQDGQTRLVRSRLLIGADGANSTVRRCYFPSHPGSATMVAFQATLRASRRPEHEPPSHQVLFASSLTDFYAWAIPKSESMLVGCAFEKTNGARERFDQVVAWFKDQLGLGEEVQGRSARRLSRPRTRAELFPGGEGVLLVGEAAGLVSPSSGEGISFALLSGAAAGRAAAATSPHGAYQRSFRPLARRVMAKTLKAKVIYSPRLRSQALRVPWCP